jgi:hypothetical protein
LFIHKFIITLLLATSSLVMANDGWVSVDRPEKVVHQLDEEDHSIWVVFAKSFGPERVLVRFPEDPVYRHNNGRFEAIATHFGSGEFELLAQKTGSQRQTSYKIQDISYRDAERGFWVRERHIDTGLYHYTLRVTHPTQSAVIFRQFTDSFEIE